MDITKVLILNQIPEVCNKFTFSLARNLKEIGVDIAVCGIEDDNVTAYNDVKFLNIFGNYSKESNIYKKIKIYNESWKHVVEYCVNNNVQIIHTQWYIFSPIDWKYHQILRKKGIKVVAMIHDLLPFNKKFYDFNYHKKIYSHADIVITQARMNIETLIHKFNVKKSKVVYIPLGNVMEYAESATKEESLNYLKVNDKNRPIILFFGQIKKVKGVDVLITAMNDVVKKYPDVLCIIAGKVWHDDFSKYQNMIDRYELNDNIRTDIRFIDDNEIKYYFNAADIVALPYRQIYQSGVVLLAYAYEKPVVATREGEFLTVVKDGETGLLVPSESPKKFAEALIWYLDNPDKAKQMAAAGKEDVSERLNWKKIASDVKKEYVKVLSNR